MSLQHKDDPPFAKPWWFHSSPLSLDDPLASLPKAALGEGTWKPFSPRDCEALEMGWYSLPDHMKRKNEDVLDENEVVDELPSRDIETKKGSKERIHDVSQDDGIVIVGVERLHQVDLVSQRSSLPRKS
jgi:hypothetical protein